MTDEKKKLISEKEKQAIEAFKDKYVCQLNQTDELSNVDIIEQNMNAIDAGINFALSELRNAEKSSEELADEIERILNLYVGENSLYFISRKIAKLLTK